MSESGRSAVDLDPIDEARDPSGRPRGAYARLFDRIDEGAFAAERERIGRALEEGGVRFGGAQSRLFDVDPVPRIVEADEWERIERGLVQRVRALNAFLTDVYGERRIVAEGVIAADLVDRAEGFEPAMAAPGMPAVRAHVAGPDLVRGSDGELRVLEDNVRAPSGLAYVLAARGAMEPIVAASGLSPRSPDPGVEALGAMLRGAAPDGGARPLVVLLNDGPDASAIYEHRELALRLGLEIAAAGELRRRGDRVLFGERPVGVIYRRVDDERLTAPDGTPTALGELLIEPLAAGTLACVNSPGTGIADDKAMHTQVETMIGFYLGEDALLPSVPGWPVGEPGGLERALERLDELVIKPRWEFGGTGVTIGPLASDEELEATAARVRRDPGAYVAQETVALSVHPTVIAGEPGLPGRHVDLRPFVITDDEVVTVVPGGLTRFAREAGVMVVNSGRGGGAKDTWVLPT